MALPNGPYAPPYNRISNKDLHRVSQPPKLSVAVQSQDWDHKH